jgi:hypothetical protein
MKTYTFRLYKRMCDSSKVPTPVLRVQAQSLEEARTKAKQEAARMGRKIQPW